MSSIAQLKQKARSFEQREQWQAALEVYEQMVQKQPEGEDLDVGVWNRVGDLHMRLGQTDPAVTAYERAVQSYADAGLHNNAIALCNKVLRITPGRPAVYLRLGQISALKGFLADARQHIDHFVERMRGAGQLDSALETLLHAAQAETDEPVLHRIVAEHLAAHGREPEALQLLAAAYRVLVERGLDVEAERVWSQIQELDPSAEPLESPAPVGADRLDVSGLVVGEEIHLPAFGEPDHDESEDDESPLEGMTSVSLGDTDAAADEILAEITQLDGLQATDLSLGDAAAGSADDAADELLGDVDLSGLDLEIREHAAGAESPEAGDPAALLGGSGVDGLEIGFETLEADEPLVAGFAAEDDLSGELRAFESGASGADALGGFESGEESGEAYDALDIRIDDEDAGEASAGEPLPFLSLPEVGGDDLPAGADLDAELDGETPEFGFAIDDSDDEDDATADDADPLPFLGGADYDAEPGAGPVEHATRNPLDGARARLAADPADADAARELVELLRAEAPDAESLRELDAAVDALAERGRFVEGLDLVRALLELTPAATALFQKQVELAFRADDQQLLIRAYLDLAEHLRADGDVDKEKAVYERVLEIDPDNDAARRGLGFPEAPASPAAEPEEGYVDLAALIFEDDPPPGSTRFVVEADEPSGDEDGDFAEILARFREQVAQNIEATDSASHYDLGVAFKEMGLLDEAISEFQIALRAGANPVATLEMLGECFVDQGQHAVAWRLLDRAVKTAEVPDADLVGVLYWMGRCDEALGRPAAAAECYERVLAVDVEFRDTVDRLRAARVTSEPPPL